MLRDRNKSICRICNIEIHVKLIDWNSEYGHMCTNCLKEIDNDIKELEQSRSKNLISDDKYYGNYW